MRCSLTNLHISSVCALLAVLTSLQVFASEQSAPVFDFPALPYAYDALEPHFDARTMEIHYQKHHRAYYDNFIKAIKGTDYENETLKNTFASISQAPPAVRNMGGGYFNHQLFWENLTPAQGKPSAELTEALNRRFGSMEAFKEVFNQQAAGLFGSGWVWLLLTPQGELEVTTTVNQDNPLMDTVLVRGTPLLALDVWEHAYYLKYQNRRTDYIAAFWQVVDWESVSRRYASALNAD